MILQSEVMKPNTKLILFLLAIVPCLYAGSVFAQEKGTAKAIQIFDGKTLNGWDGDPKFWSVEDGAITGRTTKENPTKGNTFCVWTGGHVGDFELNFDYRIEGHNSGFMLRAFPLPDSADRWRLGGYQADFDVKNQWSGTFFGEKYRGLLAKRGERASLVGTETIKNKKRTRVVAKREVTKLDGAAKLVEGIKSYPEWNKYRVIAKGNNFKLFINDKLMSECTDKDEANRRMTGLLGLQLHSGPVMKVQFKNIELTEMGESAGSEMRVAFEDDFEKGIESWEIVDPDSWKLEDHGKGQSLSIIKRESAYKPEHRSPLHISLIKYAEFDSFELTFKVKSTKNTGNHRDCCVFFNYQDPTHYYYVHLGAKPDPRSGQIMVVNGAPRAPLTENKKNTPWSESGWHDVKLVRDYEAGTIKIYFDDMTTPHMEVKDKTFGAGRIGLGSFDDMDAFDNIELRVKR